jgi:muramoyltetrapeptide carboxypeptidase
MTKIPTYLKKGDTIAITCPCSYMSREKADDCISALQKWGYDVMVGKTLHSKSKNYFSAPDQEKINELQAMLDDQNIKAIIFGRGGYGMSRIIDQLDFKQFKKNPKWLIGFSDITVLHCHLFSKYKISSIHGPMSLAFNKKSGNSANIMALHNAITGKKNIYTSPYVEQNVLGSAEGKIIGGNLSLLCNVLGTKSEFETKNKILFIEDVGEYKYALDRMLHQLKRSGKFEHLAGLIFGGFTDIKDTERPFGKKTEHILKDIVKEYTYPVCFKFPISHGKDNVPVKIGVTYELKVMKTKTTLKEL